MDGTLVKSERLLQIYSRLVSGDVLPKKELAQQFHVTERSIQRDMESLRCFFAEQGLRQDIVYDKQERGYRLEQPALPLLNNSEILAVCKILLESRSMRRDEMLPILEKLDSTYEEAAGVLGASRIRIFWQVIFPEILPAALTGFGLAFGRCLGEYGSVVFIAGNQPYETEITPLIIMSKLQEYDYTSATSIALVMLVAAFLILFLTNLVQSRSSKILKGGQ